MSNFFKDGFCLARDPFDSNVAYAGGNVYISGSGYQMAIQKSTDAGATWPTQILIGSPMAAMQTAVHDIALAPTDTQVVYAGGDENRYVKIWRTPDGGTTWFDITSNLAGHHGNYEEINAVWVSPENEDIVLVGTSKGVFKTSDGGGSWSTTGLTTNVQDMVYFPASDTLFAGTLFKGVYQSTNRGVTWQAMNNGLNSKGIRCLAIDTKNCLLFAGTSNGSTWRFPLPVPALNQDATHLSTSTGGAVNFTLDATAANAGRSYITLGSLTGTSPGTPLPGGYATLPLNWDIFTNFVLGLLNSPIFVNFLGTLDPTGKADATFDTIGPVPPDLIGFTMYFAYCLNQPYDFASNPVGLVLVP